MDINLGPISIDLIEENLYLGGLAAAKNVDVLNKRNITHILTIDTCPLPRNISDLKHITTSFIQLSDQPKEDLLSHLDEAHLFITEAVSTGAVLVHCYFGVSRSASVIIAHLMKKHRLGYAEALERVKTRRRIVCPNQGFVSQLKLYKEMGYTIDPTSMHYKIYRLTLAADRVRKVKILPQSFVDLIQPDPGVEQTQPEPNCYRCRKCRRVLALESNVIVHKDGDVACTRTVFLEPIAWMHSHNSTEGKLLCPKCSGKLGSFSWVMGCQCPCGAKVAPAFYLVPSKVDYSNVVKNIEVEDVLLLLIPPLFVSLVAEIPRVLPHDVPDGLERSAPQIQDLHDALLYGNGPRRADFDNDIID